MSPRIEDAVPIVMGRLLGTVVGVAGLVFGCGSSALGQDASIPIAGAIQVSSNNGKTVTVVTVDRPVLGEEDGLPEYAFIIVEPTETLADTIEQGEIRWASGSFNLGFLEVSLAGSSDWLFVAGGYEAAPTSARASAERQVVARTIVPLRAAGDGSAGLGAPGNGNRPHEEIAIEWFNRLLEFDGLR